MRNARSQTCKTALNAVFALASPSALYNGRGEQAYHTIVAQYEKATPTTGKIARDIEKKNDAGDRVKVQQPDDSKPRSLIALTFNTEKR